MGGFVGFHIDDLVEYEQNTGISKACQGLRQVGNNKNKTRTMFQV